MVLRFQVQFPTDQIKFIELCLRQIFRAVEIDTTVLIIGIQEGHEEVIAQVIMSLGDLMGPSPGLRIEEQRGHVEQEKSRPAPYFLIEIHFEDAIDEFPELSAAPKPLHVSLA
jgi:hypothetical protein